MTDVLRIGVLGCAAVARRRSVPALLACDRVELAAVASRDPDRAREFATAVGCDPVVGYDALLRRDDIPAVYLPLPPALLAPWALRALLAGKHVLAEKPLTGDVDTARRLVHAGRRRGLVLMENFAFLRHAQHGAVRELLATGALGRIRAVEVAFGFPPLPAHDIRYRPDLGGGALADAGCYGLRLVADLLPGPLRVAGAVLHAADGARVDTGGAILLSGAGGTSAQVAFGFERGYRNRYVVWGERGSVTVDRAFSAPPDWLPSVHVTTPDRDERLPVAPDDQLRNLFTAFATAALDCPGRPTGDAAGIIRQARLLAAVRAAAAATPAAAPTDR